MASTAVQDFHKRMNGIFLQYISNATGLKRARVCHALGKCYKTNPKDLFVKSAICLKWIILKTNRFALFQKAAELSQEIETAKKSRKNQKFS